MPKTASGAEIKRCLENNPSWHPDVNGNVFPEVQDAVLYPLTDLPVMRNKNNQRLMLFDDFFNTFHH